MSLRVDAETRPFPLCKNILVAEDNDDIRETIIDVLRSEGYRVESARDGKEALSKLKRARETTLVLLDLMMPVMSGWEFLDAQKANPALANHRIVTLSAVPPTTSLQDPTPLASSGNLTKPLSLKTLLDIAHSFCRPMQA